MRRLVALAIAEVSRGLHTDRGTVRGQIVKAGSLAIAAGLPVSVVLGNYSTSACTRRQSVTLVTTFNWSAGIEALNGSRHLRLSLIIVGVRLQQCFASHDHCH